jgi:hypothetical protein
MKIQWIFSYKIPQKKYREVKESLMVLLITFMIGCNKRKVEEKQHSFRAINGRDTAYLSLTTGDNYFLWENMKYFMDIKQ